MIFVTKTCNTIAKKLLHNVPSITSKQRIGFDEEAYASETGHFGLDTEFVGDTNRLSCELQGISQKGI